MIDNVSLELKATGAKLCEDIQNRSDDLKQDHARLADIQENLTQSRELKVAANENERDTLIKLEKLQESVKKIAQEKSSIEMKLAFKQRECQLLSEMKEKDEEYNRFLQKKIAKKKKKIKQLKEKLERKNCEFLSVQQEAQTQQEELSRARAEVKKKHEEVKELEREKEELACSYNIKKEQVSHLVQIAVALTSDKEEMKVKSVLISTTGLHTEGEHGYCVMHHSYYSSPSTGSSHLVNQEEFQLVSEIFCGFDQIFNLLFQFYLCDIQNTTQPTPWLTGHFI